MWLVYSLATVLLWGAWSVLGKEALKHSSWINLTLFFGIVSVMTCAGLATLGYRDLLRPGKLGIVVLASAAGTAGLVTFYLALDRGKASLVTPIVSIYPVITAVLAVMWLGETLSAVQVVGLGFAVVAMVLIGAGSGR
jgi:bacterial/archaeal transporter family protein